MLNNKFIIINIFFYKFDNKIYVLKCFRGKLREALEYLEKAILLSKSKKELLRIFSMRNRTKAQLEVVERLGLSI